MLELSADDDKVTAEISVQVSGNEMSHMYRPIKLINFSPNQISFSPELHHSKLERNLSRNSVSHRRKYSLFNISKTNKRLQKNYKEDFITDFMKNELKKSKRCKSGEFHTKREIKKNKEPSLEKIKKNPSVYQVPNVVNPIDNFFSEHLKAPLHVPKMKVFKDHKSCIMGEIETDKKKLSPPKYKNYQDSIKKYYFRHIPRLFKFKNN